VHSLEVDSRSLQAEVDSQDRQVVDTQQQVGAPRSQGEVRHNLQDAERRSTVPNPSSPATPAEGDRLNIHAAVQPLVEHGRSRVVGRQQAEALHSQEEGSREQPWLCQHRYLCC